MSTFGLQKYKKCRLENEPILRQKISVQINGVIYMSHKDIVSHIIQKYLTSSSLSLLRDIWLR